MSRSRTKKFGIECEFRSIYGGRLRRHLWASYEINGMSISDDYTPEEISAHDLLAMWAAGRPSGIVRIYWSVRGDRIIEALPGLIWPYDDSPEDFLTYFSDPIRCDTGEPLQWIELPVRDRHWNLKDGGDKGGFIQEATGWKPGILQAFVLVDHLIGFRSTCDVRGAREVDGFVRGRREREEAS